MRRVVRGRGTQQEAEEDRLVNELTEQLKYYADLRERSHTNEARAAALVRCAKSSIGGKIDWESAATSAQHRQLLVQLVGAHGWATRALVDGLRQDAIQVLRATQELFADVNTEALPDTAAEHLALALIRTDTLSVYAQLQSAVVANNDGCMRQFGQRPQRQQRPQRPRGLAPVRRTVCGIDPEVPVHVRRPPARDRRAAGCAAAGRPAGAPGGSAAAHGGSGRRHQPRRARWGRCRGSPSCSRRSRHATARPCLVSPVYDCIGDELQHLRLCHQHNRPTNLLDGAGRADGAAAAAGFAAAAADLRGRIVAHCWRGVR